MLEPKDIILSLFGIAIGVAANFLTKHIDQSGGANESLEVSLKSTNPAERSIAIRRCLLSGAKWYIIANIFWVVSGAAWVLDAFDQTAVRVVIGASSLFSIIYFWLALRWVVRAFKATGV